jgi:hypothetical protein
VLYVEELAGEGLMRLSTKNEPYSALACGTNFEHLL